MHTADVFTLLCVDTGFQLDARLLPRTPQQETEVINIYKQSTEGTLIFRFLMIDGVVFGFPSTYSYLPMLIISPAYQVYIYFNFFLCAP